MAVIFPSVKKRVYWPIVKGQKPKSLKGLSGGYYCTAGEREPPKHDSSYILRESKYFSKAALFYINNYLWLITRIYWLTDTKGRRTDGPGQDARLKGMSVKTADSLRLNQGLQDDREYRTGTVSGINTANGFPRHTTRPDGIRLRRQDTVKEHRSADCRQAPPLRAEETKRAGWEILFCNLNPWGMFWHRIWGGQEEGAGGRHGPYGEEGGWSNGRSVSAGAGVEAPG